MMKRFVLSFLFVGILFSGLAFSQETVVHVKIDAAKKGAPLSPLIYGQFIEHLGRCIYGGIWAEMLEDRKFWYSLDAKESFWKPLPNTKIRMNTENPFVGKHTPEASGSTEIFGITQSGIALQKGKKYIGYVWAKATENIDSINVQFGWQDATGIRVATKNTDKTDDYFKIPFEFESPVDTDNATIEIFGQGTGTLFIGTASLMPADNVQGMRADTLELLKQLDSPIYRWPGGNFVSGYDWKDGIGERDKRPPRKNPAWSGVEHNDFGVNEFMQFCRLLNTAPYIAVNTGDGHVQNALNELLYVNAPADSEMGKLRAKHGHPEPYKVFYWGIGNEMYGNWQIGHMSVSDYVKKHNEFVDAFRKADPSIHVIGVGNVGKWDEAFLPGAAEHLDSLSEHFYTQTKENVFEHVQPVIRAIRNISNAHRKYRETMPELKGKDIKIAMDEWNYWYGPHLFGELGTRYFVKDGLGIAAGIHEFARNSDLYEMANYAQTVNVIGCIKTNKTNAQFETTGLVLKLYRKEFGSIPLETKAESRDIDVKAALCEDGKTLTLGIVNMKEHDIKIQLSAEGIKIPKSGTQFVIADAENNPMAHNDPGTDQKIDIAKSSFESTDGSVITIGPYSITLLKWEIE